MAKRVLRSIGFTLLGHTRRRLPGSSAKYDTLLFSIHRRCQNAQQRRWRIENMRDETGNFLKVMRGLNTDRLLCLKSEAACSEAGDIYERPATYPERQS